MGEQSGGPRQTLGKSLLDTPHRVKPNAQIPEIVD